MRLFLICDLCDLLVLTCEQITKVRRQRVVNTPYNKKFKSKNPQLITAQKVYLGVYII